MKCIYRRLQTDGQQNINWEDLFHVATHYRHLCLPFLSFMSVFILLVPPTTPPYSCPSAAIFPRFSVSPPSSLSGLSAGYQVKVKSMPLSTLAFPWETGQTVALIKMEGRRHRLLTFDAQYFRILYNKFNIHIIHTF